MRIKAMPINVRTFLRTPPGPPEIVIVAIV